MEESRWLELVRRLEPLARLHPRAYRFRIVALAALGYAFIAGTLLVLLAFSGLVVLLAWLGHTVLLLKLLIPLCVLLVVVGRSLYVKIDPPEGLPLDRAEAPALFELIEDVRAVVGSPEVHTLLVNDDLNASVSQVPTLAGLFRTRNYLVLGVPYLALLSADELRAVVAHELAHLAGAHGRFGARVYRVRATWVKLLEGLEERESLWTAPVRWFFGWYVPYFEAYSLPAARAHELEADAAAATVSGSQTAGSTLVVGALGVRWLEDEYWPTLDRRVLDEPVPPASFSLIAQEISLARVGPSNPARWYRGLLATDGDPTDPHPPIAERLASLGCEPEQTLARAQEPVDCPALGRYLEVVKARLVAELDRAWQTSVAREWSEQHRRAQQEKDELARLEAAETLSAPELLRRAELTETFRSGDDALMRYRELLGTVEDVAARLAIERLLLAGDDEGGLRWLEQAAELDWEAILPANALACNYLFEHEREEEGEVHRQRCEQQLELLVKAENERSEVSVGDRLEPPDLPDELLERVHDAVAADREVAAAYLVRKHTEHLDYERPFYVLGVVPMSYIQALKADATSGLPLDERLAERIGLSAAVECVVVLLPEQGPLTSRLAEIEGASLLGDRSDLSRIPELINS
jgi:Zn-dependent protease with chaperone function